MLRGIFLVVLLTLAGRLWAQGIYLSYYLPGEYLSDNRHRVDLYNPLPQTVFLGGWMLITRDYAVRFPAGARIPSESSLRVVKNRSGQSGSELVLSTVPDFLIKIRNRDYEGNFVVLFNSRFDVVDAFYFSPLPQVPFLPASDTLITFSNEKIPYRLPPESGTIWSFMAMSEDPAIAFVRENGKWKFSAANAGKKTPAEFENLSLRYEEGVISIQWSTRSEEDCGDFVVERSEDAVNFEEVDKVPSHTQSKAFQQYSDALAEARQDKTFYFRIRATNTAGVQSVSKVEAITTTTGIEEFTLDAFMGLQAGARELNVRFSTQFSQRVNIRLLDERLHELGLLFRDYVYADTPNLLKTTQIGKSGWYWVLAETETRRFWKKVWVS